MKIDSTFRIFAFLMAVLIFSIPFVSYAQQKPINKADIEAGANAQAIADAENDVNKTGWFMDGCFLNIIGVVMARTIKAPVPAERLVGKPPTYIFAYTSAYYQKQTENQTTAAVGIGIVVCLVIGCLIINDIDDGCIVGSGGGGSLFGGWCAF